MTAKIIDGKALGEKLRNDIAAAVASLKRERNVVPGLATVLVGEDPASRVYVANKGRQTREAGMNSFDHRLPTETSQQALLALVDSLNADDAVDGILVQLPLPAHIDSSIVLERIDPAKDVDGFHPVNVGRLASGAGGLAPCTPIGAMMLIGSVRPDISGCDALVLGRSNIVGKPMAQLLLAANATVTIAHSRTRNLPDLCRRADILVAAIGRPGFVRGDWIKAGAIVVDVGINRVGDPASPDGRSRLVGDVAFAEAAERAEAITPVPGGVGPMTIACLLSNTVKAARARRNLPAN